MTLSLLLQEAFQKFADRPAVEECGRVFTYHEMWRAICQYIVAMDTRDPSKSPIAIISDHSFEGYCAIIAALVTGRTYVPIKPDLPQKRIHNIVRAAKCALATGDEELREKKGKGFGNLAWIDREESRGSGGDFELPCDDPIAYLMFTSGSTGVPKGVVIKHSNLFTYINAAQKLFPLNSTDRCSQFFEISFDLSVHDILMTLSQGAALIVDARKQAIDPVGFASKAALTVWFSVPSVLSMAKRFRRLVANTLTDLRLSLFCGEALPIDLAKAWLTVAPNAECYNVYGPTEATIAITYFRFDEDRLLKYDGPTVPIGIPYPGSQCRLEVLDDGSTELLLSGPQLSSGYLDEAEKTAASFVEIDELRWYRTGDIVELEHDYGFIYLSRKDSQVKIDGYRIELAEIEIAIRDLNVSPEVAAFSFDNAGKKVLAAALVSPTSDPMMIVELLRKRLPGYMIPAKFVFVDSLPLNSNGKVDRDLLSRRLI